MGVTNVFFTDQYTSLLQRVVQEVVTDPKQYLGIKYIPSVSLPVDTIQADVIEAYGGLTNEHLLGTDPEYIQRFGVRQQEFKPPTYREAIHWNEKDILHLRKLGQNDRSQRGIRQYINKAVDQLNVRLEARMEYLRWQAIFTGGFTFMGRTFSYNVPAANQATLLGAKWSLDGTNTNNAANPLIDLRYWLTGGYAPFRKYAITGILSNPNTARWFLDNSNTRSYIQNAFANPSIKEYGVNDVLKFMIPGCPTWEIYNGWYQTQQVGAGTPTLGGTPGPNQITVSNANFFIPDGAILFSVTLPDQNQIGELVLGLHLAEGTLDNPGYGKFLVVDENIAPGTQGGPKNPYVDLVAGINGGVNLYRAWDTLTAQVS